MKPEIYIYAERYTEARRLANILYRPAMDSIEICTEVLWNDGQCIVVNRDTEIFYIASKEGAIL